jgi:8-oxo-dGTP pyrophosphatase MutT (NUDIX family)
MSEKDRSNQRYTPQGDREVAVAMIFARVESEWSLVFVTSRNHPDKLTLPKGGWESYETVEDAARREAVEESGARCQPSTSLETWQHQVYPNHGKHLRSVFHVIPLLFDHFDGEWLEQQERKRFLIPVTQIIDCSGQTTVMLENEVYRLNQEFVEIVSHHFRNEAFRDLFKMMTS